MFVRTKAVVDMCLPSLFVFRELLVMFITTHPYNFSVHNSLSRCSFILYMYRIPLESNQPKCHEYSVVPAIPVMSHKFVSNLSIRKRARVRVLEHDRLYGMSKVQYGRVIFYVCWNGNVRHVVLGKHHKQCQLDWVGWVGAFINEQQQCVCDLTRGQGQILLMLNKDNKGKRWFTFASLDIFPILQPI